MSQEFHEILVSINEVLFALKITSHIFPDK